MNAFQCFALALKSLATSKIRALLTMLGIIIGVAAVIVIMSLGNGLTTEVSDAFDSMGTNTITVNITGRGSSSRSISVNEMYEMAEKNSDSIKALTPTVQVMASPKIGSESYNSAVTGVGEDYLTIKSWEISEGRFINYIDIKENKRVCVVGAYYNSMEAFDGDALGNTVRINGYDFTVVGVIENQTDDWEDEDSSDNMILIPYSTAAKLLSRTSQINSYTILAQNEDTVAAAKLAVENTLYKAFSDDSAYTIINMAEILDVFTEIMDTMVLALALIAGISLLVGGIGIMNIMLVSVAERTREIGIRKALGAKPKHIKMQFVIEAGTTSTIGGIIGIALGVVFAQVIGNMVNLNCVPTVTSVVISFGVSVLIGVVFGFLPANKAAKLNPIDALRND